MNQRQKARDELRLALDAHADKSQGATPTFIHHALILRNEHAGDAWGAATSWLGHRSIYGKRLHEMRRQLAPVMLECILERAKVPEE